MMNCLEFKKATEDIFKGKVCKNKEKIVQKQIVFQLIGREGNENFLSEIPHREFLDLAIVYRVILGTREEGIKSILVRNSMMEDLRLDEEDLYEYAVKNTKRIFPSTIQWTSEVLFGKKQEDDSLLVISNEERAFGAAAILFQENLEEIAKRFQSDFYILPSSIHECIATVATGDREEPVRLLQMVRNMNKEVSPGEVLSNSVYLFDREDGRLIALRVPA